MDTRTPNTNDDPRNISLGGGVDIVPPADDIDDVEIESYNDDAVSGGEMTDLDRIKRLREKLAKCAEEKSEYLDGWQRSKAEFINYKKREEEGKAEFLKYAREELVVDLLPVLESFSMAFANKEAWEKVDASWRGGVEHIHNQLLQILNTHGLVIVNPLNEEFNPKEHTAVASVHTDDKALLHKIAEVLQVGYRLNGKLVRSPRVKVYGEPETDATKPG